jgi:hypothetical protein
MDAPQTEMYAPRKRRKLPLWQALALILVILLCASFTTMVILLDQTTALGMAYLRAVNTGNAQAAELLADHYDNTTTAQQTRYTLDIQRDIARFGDAELSDIETQRGQTMSGQWVTALRFKYRPSGSTGAWSTALLYVKTEKWFLLPYIRAVEERE